MDHLKNRTTSFDFVYPPIVDIELIKVFNEELKEHIPEKIRELLTYLIALKKDYDQKKTLIEKAFQEKVIDDFGLFFNSFINAVKFSEYEVVQEWLKYWLNIMEQVSEYKNWFKYETNGYSEEQINEAKRYPISQLFNGKLTRTGNKRLLGLCPFHKESTPSLCIYEDSNTCYCFGCSFYSDSIGFLMKRDGVDFKKAIKLLL